MKQLLKICLFMILILPNIVWAAWWNPFSWKIFNMPSKPKIEVVQIATSTDKIATTTEEKTEVEKLRAEIEELKKESKNKADNRSTEKTPPKQSSVSNAPVKTESPAQNLNFNSLAIDNYNSSIKLAGMQIDKLKLISSDADRYLDGLPPLISKAKTGAQLFPEDSEFWNLIVDIYSKHRNNIENHKKTVSNYIATLEDYQNQLSGKIIRVQSQNISLREAETITNTVHTDRDKIENSVDAITESYNSLTNAFLDDKDAVSEALEIRIYDTRSAISALESQRRTAPVYTTPTMTNCFYYSHYGGGNLNCYSY